MTIVEYVTEEVERQGHDTKTQDGLIRVSWMLEAWCYAMDRTSGGQAPCIPDIIAMGRMIEKNKNRDGFRSGGVRVGDRRCPPPEEIRGRMETLFSALGPTTIPLEFYMGFELVHPFNDGNGRTGKILLNWVNRTLATPVFPPADIWGRPIRNP